MCLNALGSDWTPLYNLRTVVEQLLPQLVRYPNPDDPLNEEAAALLLAQDVEGYVHRARAEGPGRPPRPHEKRHDAPPPVQIRVVT